MMKENIIIPAGVLGVQGVCLGDRKGRFKIRKTAFNAKGSILLLAMIVSVVTCGKVCAGGVAPDGMMLELLSGSTVSSITDPTPEFGWIVHSSSANDRQVAYRILVAGDLAMLDRGKADMWDSGQVSSASSINVSYRGKTLLSHRSYYWKVKTWCQLDGESEWSGVMPFKTGDVSQGYTTARHPLTLTEVPPVSITQKAKGHYLIDFGKVAFGSLRLIHAMSEADQQIEVHFGEAGDKNGIHKKPGGTIRYYKVIQTLKKGSTLTTIHTPKDGRNTGKKAIQVPSEFGVISPFRYVELVNYSGPLTKPMITQMAVHYPFDETASTFESSSPVLNAIWALCKYSMKATSFCGVYVDGDRERIPYEADAYINQLSHYGVDREYALARYSHEYLLVNPTWPTEWKQHSVMMAWADYMYTGNTESLAENYEILKTQKTLEFRARPDGLLNTQGLRDIVDWPGGERDGYQFKEVNTVVNAFYYKTLLQMADIATALGKASDAAAYQKKAAVVKSVFNTVLFDAKRGRYVDGEGAGHSSLHANMMPLAFGLVPEDRQESVADFVVSKGMACSVYGAQYLLEALYESGRAEAALERMTAKEIRSWSNMLQVGSTITLEAWDNKFKPNQDWNHAWGAAPGNIIPRYLLGVRPIEAGFGRVLIQPHPGSLRKASGTVPTIRGSVGVSFENPPEGPFTLTVDLPVNMAARVGIPRGGQSSSFLTLDGQKVKARSQGGYLFVDGIGSGSHTLRTLNR